MFKGRSLCSSMSVSEPGKRVRGSLRRGLGDPQQYSYKKEGRNSPTHLALLCEAHEQREWRDIWRQRNRYNQSRDYGPRNTAKEEPVAVTNTIRTIGVLEIKGKINQQERSIIIDTGACVSCLDETLVIHRRNAIRPVHGVNMKTATDELVQNVGRTHIILEIQGCYKLPNFRCKRT